MPSFVISSFLRTILFIVEVGVHLHYVWMMQANMRLNLPLELPHHTFLQQSFLANLFDHKNLPRLCMPNLVDLACVGCVR